MHSTPFKLSIINYLNAEPLNFGFKHGLSYRNFHLKFHHPATSCDALQAHEVDAGLISSIEYLRIPNLQIIPNLCIASPRQAKSVLLVSKKEPKDIRSLALDTSSRTSVVLVQILLRQKFGNNSFTANGLAPDLNYMLHENDAALMIGDQAMRCNTQGYFVFDLAEQWQQWTGLPFVFAFWAVRPEAPKVLQGRPLSEFFEESFNLGMKNLGSIIDDAQLTSGWTNYQLKSYFTENIAYRLGEKESESLSFFYQKAVELGFVPADRKLAFL